MVFKKKQCCKGWSDTQWNCIVYRLEVVGKNTYKVQIESKVTPIQQM